MGTRFVGIPQKKKKTRGDSTCGNATSTQTNTITSTEVIFIPESPQKSSGLSSSPTSLNLTSWDGLIDNYFEDVSNKSALIKQEPYNNVDLSLTGEEIPSRPWVATHSSSLPGLSSAGSASDLIVLDSTPEETPPIATQTSSATRPRRNVGPIQFYGESRYVDIVDVSETEHGPEKSPVTTPTFVCLSPSDFLTPLTNPPHRQMLVAETTLTGSSNSASTGNAQTAPLTPLRGSLPPENSPASSQNKNL